MRTGARSSFVRYGCYFLVLVGLVFAGCRSTVDWNPRIDLSEYEKVVVLDFNDGEYDIGVSMADKLAGELAKRGSFEIVERGQADGRAIVIEGRILRYREGNVAARMKIGNGVGQGQLSVTVAVFTQPGGERVGEFEVDQTTQLFGPEAGRTGREDANWLQREVVSQIADKLDF